MDELKDGQQRVTVEEKNGMDSVGSASLEMQEMRSQLAYMAHQRDNMEENFSMAMKEMMSQMLAEFRAERLEPKNALKEVIGSQKDLIQVPDQNGGTHVDTFQICPPK